MRIISRACLFLLLANLTGVASAGQAYTSIGRALGLGWGPGYHAYNNCPTGNCQTAPLHGQQQTVYGAPVWRDGPAPQPIEHIAPPRSQPLPAPTPAKSDVQSRPPAAPVLPSQRMSQQPVFWYK